MDNRFRIHVYVIQVSVLNEKTSYMLNLSLRKPERCVIGTDGSALKATSSVEVNITS